MATEVICIYKQVYSDHEHSKLVLVSPKTMDVVESIELPLDNYNWSGWKRVSGTNLLAKSTFSILSLKDPNHGEPRYSMAFSKMLRKFPEFNGSRSDLEVKPIKILSSEFVENVKAWEITAEWGLYKTEENLAYFPELDYFKMEMEDLGFDMDGYGEERKLLLEEDVYRALISKYKDYEVINFIKI